MNKIGIYLHFPFCKGKCSYCDFYSLPALLQKEAYEKALCRWIAAFSSDLADYEVNTVYLGGGTPSLFSPEGLLSVFDALRRTFRILPQAEITMEMNPESAAPSVMEAAKKVGVNRISFGMQSSIDAELSAIGRLHCHKDTVDAVNLAKEMGFENISLDLMYGLPGQSLRSFRESLEACVLLSPKHISFYCLTLSEKVPLYRMKDSLPGEEETREMYLFASRFLSERGFEHYEISNAAFPGFASRHNKRYWERGEYLGIGPGAHSFFRGERFWMKESVDQFMSASNVSDIILDREKVTPEEERTEYVMLSLRQKEGIDLAKLRLLSDEAFCKHAEKKMALWCRYGLCKKTEAGYALTPEGFFVSNEMISELI